MNVLNIQKIQVSIGTRDLLDIENLQVQNGQRIGLIGKNGSGKSTFFRVLMKEVEAEISNFSLNGQAAILPQLKRTDTTKSGGEISQEYMIQALSKPSNLLLADEPTTNLDTSHIEWVENKLNDFQGAVILVSHDRTLLDNVCDTIWELEDGKITEYSGNYSAYVMQKENQQKHQQKEYEKYQQKKKQLEEAVTHKEQQAMNATKKPKNLSISENRILGAKTYYQGKQKGLHQNRKALESRLEKLDVVEKPKEQTPIRMDLPNERAFRNKTLIKAENASGKAGDKKLWEPTRFFINGGDKVAIIGPNGSGKTTLIKKIIKQSDEAIYCSPAMKIGYFAQNLDILHKDQTILQNVKNGSKQEETLIRTVLARLGFYNDEVHKKVHVLSGGERVKVSFAKLFVGDYNTLILDEPTNHLDIYALEALEELLKEYTGTLLFVSHDRQFVSSIATKILSFEEDKLSFFEGTFATFLKQEEKENTRDVQAEELIKIELSITETITKLSEPLLIPEEKEKLERNFQDLLEQKRKIEK